MIGGVNCRGGLPGVPDRVTVSARVKFCQGGVTRLGGVRFVLHQTLAKSFWRRVFFLLKDLTVTRMPLATALKDCSKSINCQNVVCPSFFWLHAWRIFTNLEKVHNGTRAGILHVNAGYFFYPIWAGYITSGPPFPCKQALNVGIAWGRNYSRWLINLLFY